MTINLSTFSSSQGIMFKYNGTDPFYNGYSISNAGDFNGDGIKDIAISSLSVTGLGSAYVIYGKPSGLIDPILATTTSSDALKIYNSGPGYGSGGYITVKSAGDFNKDGFDDILFGAPDANTEAGTTYLIFGNNSTGSTLNLSSLTASQGFRINGDGSIHGQLGYSVSGGDDFNNDGFDDIIIGAPAVKNASEIENSAAYIILGKNSSIADIDITLLSTQDGIKITHSESSQSGWTKVANFGDINNDGFSEFALCSGAPYSYVAYVINGKDNYGSNINLNSTTPSESFKIYTNDDEAVYSRVTSIGNVGDVNGDTISDFAIGLGDESTLVHDFNYAGVGYIIFGKSGTFGNLNINNIT